MRIIATPILSQDLKFGDMFSTYGPKYWQGDRFGKLNGEKNLPIGKRVYIRTETETPEDQYNIELFKITIEHNVSK
jgi:hypothetical protein